MRVIFNCDGDSMTLSQFEPPISIQQVCRTIDELEGTGIGVYVYSLNRGGIPSPIARRPGRFSGRMWIVGMGSWTVCKGRH